MDCGAVTRRLSLTVGVMNHEEFQMTKIIFPARLKLFENQL